MRHQALSREGRPLVAALLGSTLTAICAAVWLLSPNFAAKFGPLDDSEILSWLGGSNRLPITEYFTTLVQETEVGRFGDYARFRPAIYAVKVLETVIAGNNVQLHYSFVVISFGVTTILLGLSTAWWLYAAVRINRVPWSSVFAGLTSVVTTLLFVGLASWSDIATRLGPSERLAAFGLALATLSLTALVFRGRPAWWVGAIVGVSLAVLSKENFLMLSAAPLVVAVYRWKVRSDSRAVLFAAALGLIPAIVLVIALAPTLGTGSDIYGGSTGVSRIGATLTSLFVTYRWYWLPSALILVVSWLVWALVRGIRGRPDSILAGALIALAFLWRAFDAWIYSVHGYVYPRYELVPQLFRALAVLAAVSFALGALTRARTQATKAIASFALIGALAMTILTLRSVPSSLELIRQNALANQRATVAYGQALDRVSSLASQSPQRAIAIVARAPIDAVESVKSVALELERRNPNLNVVVLPDLPNDQIRSPLGIGLSELAKNGDPNLHLESIRAIDPIEGLICAVINDSMTGIADCEPGYVVEIPVRYI